ncbi:AAA family ATPase [Vibrio fluvialis]|nr:AAA family ATPase [Vibrio fluvialis]
MKFNQLLVKVSATDMRDYGYSISFGPGLNIVRGDNSSGKSTFVNSLIYVLGMEEIIGARGNASLPYALKERFDLNGVEKRVVESSAYLEIQNKQGKVITLKRVIVSKEVDSKVIQIIDGAYLTQRNNNSLTSKYTFLHDPGSAQDPERGFFAYLERFLGLELPKLSDNKGKETRLYLQSVFAALLIEQKRGWTDYIANIPYYGVSGMREKVASFLLDLDSFRNAKTLSEYQSARAELMSLWAETTTALKVAVESKYLSISGVSKTPVTDFDRTLVVVGQRNGVDIKPLEEVRLELAQELIRIDKAEKNKLKDEPKDIVRKIEILQNKIGDLLIAQGICGKQIKINESQLKQYEHNLVSTEKDLKANKLTQKLITYGVNETDLNVAKGRCQTCLNIIDDILISPDSVAMPMSIEENIAHLDNQRKMIQSLIDGLTKSIEKDKNQLLTINRTVVELRQELVSLRHDIKSTNSVTEADIRHKIVTETRQQEISQIDQVVDKALDELTTLSANYKAVNSQIASFSRYQFTKRDLDKITSFATNFKELARKFGYRSADVDEIEIKKETLLPYLQDIELREQVETPTEISIKKATSSTDIKTDSSASDFVRLIWAYLISLYKASANTGGNHLGILLFDEPAQHSMSTKSVNAMLETLSTTQGLQSIVAASFDENEETFSSSVEGLTPNVYRFTRLPRKIIETI